MWLCLSLFSSRGLCVENVKKHFLINLCVIIRASFWKVSTFQFVTAEQRGKAGRDGGGRVNEEAVRALSHTDSHSVRYAHSFI